MPPGTSPVHASDVVVPSAATTTFLLDAEPGVEPTGVNVKANVPPSPTADLTTLTVGSLTLVNEHEMFAPAAAVNVTLRVVCAVTVAPVHD